MGKHQFNPYLRLYPQHSLYDSYGSWRCGKADLCEKPKRPPIIDKERRSKKREKPRRISYARDRSELVPTSGCTGSLTITVTT
jgi:hypothetical protein